MKKLSVIVIVIVIVAVGLVAAHVLAQAQDEPVPPNPAPPPPASNGPTREDLEARIREKTAALEKINRDLETTNQNLEATQAEKVSLQRELKTLQANISQLELNIKADEIASEKLGLEIDSLGYDIREIEINIVEKNDAIGHLLRELQKSGNDNLLVVFLKNNSLADGVWATQSLKNLRSQLAVDIANLNTLQGQLGNKLQQVNTKKLSVELHQKNLSARKVIVKDQQVTRQVTLDQTKNKESEYQKQLTDLKTQQDAISDEIAKVEEQLRLSFDVSLLPLKRPGVFGWPVQLVADGGKGRITQHFGEVSRLYRGKPHNGLDIGAPVGTPVFAAEDGVVSAVDNNDRSSRAKYQYGKYVLIKHPNNLSTLYAHLSSYIVAKGEEVVRGQLIGYVGATGYATGPHLHFGAYWSASIQMKSIPPAAGLVPIGVVVEPEGYL